MKIIENERVKLLYLDLQEWGWLLKNPKKLEEKYDLSKSENQDDPIIQEIMIDLLNKIKSGLMNYEVRPVCAIVYKPDNKIIGTISLKGKMKPKKFLDYYEIGYGINEKYWNKGITSEALKLFIEIIKENKNILKYSAETDLDNLPSQKVLRKNGFKKVLTKNNSMFWTFDIELSKV